MQININIYDVIVAIITLILLIWSIYSRIKYLCLKKASEEIAKVESIKNLTNQQRFALVVTWIDKDLPEIFKNSLVRAILEKLVQFAYNNAYDYARKYISRKTGLDISSLIKSAQDKETTSNAYIKYNENRLNYINYVALIDDNIMLDVIKKGYSSPDIK